MPVNAWRFLVKEGREQTFIRMNQLDWPQLFRQSPDYRGTTVYRYVGNPRSFIVHDHWSSRNAFESLLAERRTEYDRLSAEHHALCDEIEELGFYEAVTRL